ncbi:MAG TPA: CGNR zinc finger domain-containing protein [Steroidobacteraceae bacterium]|nr:CGNR zinc finger domain-containing protein [Steroidobacteraceae bacterium]
MVSSLRHSGQDESGAGGSPPAWRFVGGNLCLDFVNTTNRRVPVPQYPLLTRPDEECLLDYGRLLEWAHAAGCLEPQAVRHLTQTALRDRAPARRVWRRALVLREALYRIAVSVVERTVADERALNVLNREVGMARDHLVIAARKGELVESFQGQRGELGRPLWPIALSAGQFFVHGVTRRLKRCPGSGCDWLFIDVTKNGSRTWCSMADCGNRSKLTRYRMRRRKATLRTT